MDEKSLEQKINEALVKGTEDSLQMRGPIWNNINKRIKDDQQNQIKKPKGFRKNGFQFRALAAAAAAALVVFMFTTEPGQAAVKKITEILVPQKQIVEEPEGIKEKNEVSLEKRVGYTLYIDKERYDMKKSNNIDKIVPRAKPSGDFPEIYMEIKQVTGTTPSEQAEAIKKDLEEEYPIVDNRGEVEEPVNGYLVTARTGNKFNDKVLKYYFVDNTKGGTFILKQQLFVEAEEGHGYRFDSMLKGFRIGANQ